ncbi:hypothetical protein H5410_002829 [Solanum commersonii]|uniref:Uncharacterized protein n=1 Tax=Solanum commersonii TaxID=4109 RepID=A0A9J6B3A2_SOLCO|nr:hypothetical protein H5410_002829 [Solanum commersonii]
MLNHEFDDVDMNNHDAEIGKDDVSYFESHNPPTPIVGSNIPCSSQSSRVSNVRDDETGFYKGMTFKNKEELANSLKIACLKEDFRLKKVISLSTRDMSNQLCTELGCKVSYWKIYKSMEHAKSNVRVTHEHGYAVLNAYLTHFYNASKAYDRCGFNDHFNPIRDLVPRRVKLLNREKYLLHMFIKANLEEGDIRDGVELVNHFQQEKISLTYVGTLATKELHAQIEMLHKYC